jgi:hypothetical protein
VQGAHLLFTSIAHPSQTSFQLDCNGLEALNVHPSGGAAAGTISVCTFDASFALTTGVTGNYFEGQGTPSAWTGNNVDVYVINHAQSNSKRKISGAVRVNGCRLNFKDKPVEPPILLASSLMQCGWRDTGNQNSLVFTSHNGQQTVKIVNRETDQRDDTWPFFCQVDSTVFWLILLQNLFRNISRAVFSVLCHGFANARGACRIFSTPCADPNQQRQR